MTIIQKNEELLYFGNTLFYYITMAKNILYLPYLFVCRCSRKYDEMERCAALWLLTCLLSGVTAHIQPSLLSLGITRHHSGDLFLAQGKCITKKGYGIVIFATKGDWCDKACDKLCPIKLCDIMFPFSQSSYYQRQKQRPFRLAFCNQKPEYLLGVLVTFCNKGCWRKKKYKLCHLKLRDKMFPIVTSSFIF